MEKEEDKLSQTELILRVQNYMALEAEDEAVHAALAPLNRRRVELGEALSKARCDLGEYTHQHGQQIVVIDGIGTALFIPSLGRNYPARSEVYPSKVGVVHAPEK